MVRGAIPLSLLMMLAVHTHAAVADPAKRYEVRDEASGRLLYGIRGWTEDVPDDAAGTVAVRSRFEFQTGSEFEETATFDPGTPPQCRRWEWTVRDANGSTVAMRRTEVVPDAFPFLRATLPPDTYPLYPMYALIGHVFTHLDLGRRNRATFHYPLMDTAMLEMELWVHKRERIRVPAGEFDVWQIRMRPTVRSLYPSLPSALQPFVSYFIPADVLWLTTTEPQWLVRLVGTIGPPGSPRVEVALVDVETDTGAPGSR